VELKIALVISFAINSISSVRKHFNNPMHWNKFRKIRNEVTSLVRNAKDKYNNCKKWWNIVKQISRIKGSDSKKKRFPVYVEQILS
jgi:hypothetical protein